MFPGTAQSMRLSRTQDPSVSMLHHSHYCLHINLVPHVAARKQPPFPGPITFSREGLPGLLGINRDSSMELGVGKPEQSQGSVGKEKEGKWGWITIKRDSGYCYAHSQTRRLRLTGIKRITKGAEHTCDRKAD